MEDFKDPKQINSMYKLRKEVEKFLVIEDDYIIPIITANIIGNRLNSDPFWLLLVGASSSGKTEFLNMTFGLDFVHPVSDLTTNSFASGMIRNDAETSLLHTINNGIMVLKDFTSILSKDHKTRDTLMGQFREVFDGKYDKKTGTGQNISWSGKVGVIAGVTEVIYRYLEVLSAMGDRFIMYNMKQPDRIKATEKAFENSNKVKEYRQHIQDCFTEFSTMILDFIDDNEEILDRAVDLDPKVKKEIMDVADFATRARSAVMTDFKSGLVDFVPAPEMPMRMAQQLQVVASSFIIIQMAEELAISPTKKVADLDMQLKEWHRKILIKIPFDSIPRTRRDVLIPLAKYKGGVTTAGLATYMDLPTESVKKYLTQVNALGLCTRVKSSGPYGDEWKLKEKYRKILIGLEDIKVVDGVLDNDDEDDEDEYQLDEMFDDDQATTGNELDI